MPASLAQATWRARPSVALLGSRPVDVTLEFVGRCFTSPRAAVLFGVVTTMLTSCDAPRPAADLDAAVPRDDVADDVLSDADLWEGGAPDRRDVGASDVGVGDAAVDAVW